MRKLVRAAVLVFCGALSVQAQDKAPEFNKEQRHAIHALKQISTAQILFREGDKDNDTILDYAASLKELGDAKLISKELASGTYQGYRFKVTHGDPPQFVWMATAVPTHTRNTRSFAVNHEGTIVYGRKLFPHEPKCKIKGTPVPKAILRQGKPRKVPAGPFAKALVAAVEAKTFDDKLVPRSRRRGGFFLVQGKRLRIVAVGVRDDAGHRIEVIDFDPKTTKAWTSNQHYDSRGELTKTKVSEMVFPPQRGKRPKKLLEIYRRDRTVQIEDEVTGKTRKVTWKPNTITVEQALFLLPRLVAHLPASLKLTVAKDADPLADPLEVAIAGSGAERTVTLTHPKLGKAVATVKGTVVETLTDFDGTTWKGTSEGETRKAFMSVLKLPARKNVREAIQAGNEAAAIGGLKVISTSQSLFREADKDGNGELDYAGDLKALGKSGLIDGVLASGTKQGFRFKVTRSKKTPEFLWMATAEPVELGKTGTRYFAINHTGVIYHSLKPFKHTEDCKITGIPLGRELPGWKRPAAKGPALPATGETRALAILRSLNSAQALFREGDKDRDGVLDYASSLKELLDTKLLSKPALDRSGYTFKVCNGSDAPEFTWMAIASPKVPGKTGDRYFATNHAGVTFWSEKPIQLDTKTCEIPKGLQAVGR